MIPQHNEGIPQKTMRWYEMYCQPCCCSVLRVMRIPFPWDDPWVAILPSKVPYSTFTFHGNQLPNQVTLVRKPQRKVPSHAFLLYMVASRLGVRNASAEQLQLLLNLKGIAHHSHPVQFVARKVRFHRALVYALYWSPFMMAAVV